MEALIKGEQALVIGFISPGRWQGAVRGWRVRAVSNDHGPDRPGGSQPARRACVREEGGGQDGWRRRGSGQPPPIYARSHLLLYMYNPHQAAVSQGTPQCDSTPH